MHCVTVVQVREASWMIQVVPILLRFSKRDKLFLDTPQFNRSARAPASHARHAQGI